MHRRGGPAKVGVEAAQVLRLHTQVGLCRHGVAELGHAVAQVEGLRAGREAGRAGRGASGLRVFRSERNMQDVELARQYIT